MFLQCLGGFKAQETNDDISTLGINKKHAYLKLRRNASDVETIAATAFKFFHLSNFESSCSSKKVFIPLRRTHDYYA